MEEELIKEKTNSRKKLLAFLLSVLVPGLGQLYNGQPRKTVIYSVGLLTLPIGFNLLGLKPYFWAYAALIISLIVLRLAIAIEAALTAGRTKEFQLKNYNKWYIYLAIVPIWYFAVYAGESITETTRYKSFRVRSDAGNPNLIAGDYVLGDFRFYNSKQPEYGDLIVFSIPNGGSQVFRIVGMPNDTLNLENQLVNYKNKKSGATLVSSLTWKDYETEEFIETLPNDFKYRIYRNKTPSFADKATIKDIIVPAGSYFVLGDNRDFSADSRYVGFVQRQQIQGKLLNLYFSKDFSKINKSLTE
jgi:signal peptidase I